MVICELRVQSLGRLSRCVDERCGWELLCVAMDKNVGAGGDSVG